MKDKLKKYVSLILHRRFDFVLQAIAWSVPRWLFFYNHAVYIKSDKPAWKCRVGSDCQVRLGRPEDSALFEKIGTPKDTALARFEAGERVGLVVKDGGIVAAVWGGAGKRFLKYSGVSFDPGPDGVFYYGAYTRAKDRGRGYFSAARICLYDSFAADGRPLNWGVISANNPKWLAAVLRQNFARVGETIYVKALFINICYYRKWFHPRNKLHIYFRSPGDILSV